MPSKRTGYSPWSLTREAGVQSATVEGTIEVPQSVQPTISTGFVDEKGNWKGEKSSDENFFGITKHVAVANGGETLSPDTGTRNFIDMTGFSDLVIAIKPSNGGNYAITAVMGPDTNSYANLSPVNPGTTLRGLVPQYGANSFNNILSDTAESLNGNVWAIIMIQDILKNQGMMQLKVTNNSGGASDIEVGFMRLV